ncbi:hypothetical protein [Catenuloplanes japonicus]|uniref:hypothetical protein n=1 Tax=Catenuloplanes japonicus TaxID=33876 RepID=UPI0005276431|nr:hypothetical protein [Catenuloplanes japonicus]
MSNQMIDDLAQLRARVRGAQRIVSAPLLTFGVLVLIYPLVALLAGLLGAGGNHLVVLAYWPLATAAGLVTLWLAARRRTLRDGVGEGTHDYGTATRTYLVVLVIMLVGFIPALFIGVFMPLVWPALVLIALAVWQRSNPLYTWAAAIGITGGVTTVLLAASSPEGNGWFWLPIHAAVGLAMIIGGLVIRRREAAA